jgi:hypothetical protein
MTSFCAGILVCLCAASLHGQPVTQGTPREGQRGRMPAETDDRKGHDQRHGGDIVQDFQNTAAEKIEAV